ADVSTQEGLRVSLLFEGEELPFLAQENVFYLPLDQSSEEYEMGIFTARLDDKDADVFFLMEYRDVPKREWMKKNGRIPLVIVTKDSYAACFLTLTGTSLMRFTPTQYLTADQMPVFELKVYDAFTKRDWVKTCYTTSRLHGNTSLAYDKKSLRLKLLSRKEDGSFTKENKNLLGLRDDDDWILNALYADDSKIRDLLANELWNETGALSNPYGAVWGTKVAYVEVFMNDGYMGLYGLMHPIDRKQVGLQSVSSQMAADHPIIERLYKKKYTAAWFSQDFAGDLPDPKMPDYRGGFYLKGDTILQNEEEWAPLRELAECLEAGDAAFAEEITQIADQTNVLENWLFYNAIGGFDNYAKNYYYLVKDQNGESYGYFIPWDLNLSFGDVYADNAYYAEFKESVVQDLIHWEPAQRMIDQDVQDSRRIVSETWKRWRKGAFSTQHVLGRMDEIYDSLVGSGAYAREMLRFPEGRYTLDVEAMKRFAEKRLQWLDQLLGDPFFQKELQFRK
ncbi:MAG: CotH kinase family protein, partial [Lachnospiraceae bacterium]|nr:CotH kinase family protein [Lachnospiraceae bacterium]